MSGTDNGYAVGQFLARAWSVGKIDFRETGIALTATPFSQQRSHFASSVKYDLACDSAMLTANWIATVMSPPLSYPLLRQSWSISP